MAGMAAATARKGRGGVDDDGESCDLIATARPQQLPPRRRSAVLVAAGLTTVASLASVAHHRLTTADYAPSSSATSSHGVGPATHGDQPRRRRRMRRRCESLPFEPGQTSFVLLGDVALARGLDFIQRTALPDLLFQRYKTGYAHDYVDKAENVSGGRVPYPVEPGYVWGDAAVMTGRHPGGGDGDGGRGADLVIANVETALTTSDAAWPDKPIRYRTHPENVEVLREANVDVATLANNHALDFSSDGLEEALGVLRDAGIRTAGAGATAVDARRGVGCGRVAVVAFGERSSGISRRWFEGREEDDGAYRVADLAGSNPVAELRRRLEADGVVASRNRTVVLSVHWDGNWNQRPVERHRRLAHAFVDAGLVDVVFGHSTHHIKRWSEVYRGRLIVYGAGDALNDYEGIKGGIPLKKRDVDGKVTPKSADVYRPGLMAHWHATTGPDGGLEALRVHAYRSVRLALASSAVTDQDSAWLMDTLQSGGMRFRNVSASVFEWIP